MQVFLPFCHNSEVRLRSSYKHERYSLALATVTHVAAHDQTYSKKHEKHSSTTPRLFAVIIEQPTLDSLKGCVLYTPAHTLHTHQHTHTTTNHIHAHTSRHTLSASDRAADACRPQGDLREFQNSQLPHTTWTERYRTRCLSRLVKKQKNTVRTTIHKYEELIKLSTTSSHENTYELVSIQNCTKRVWLPCGSLCNKKHNLHTRANIYHRVDLH